jgi:ribose 5-phosphate isomerase B
VRIAISTDERTPLIDALIEHVGLLGHEPMPLALGAPWPDAARAVARAVADGTAARGIVCCWTGTGVSIAATKIAGVRAALCGDAETVRGARRWNDANVLALSLRLTTETLALEMLEAFLATEADPAEAALIAGLEGRRV